MLQTPRLEAAVIPGEDPGIRRENAYRLIIYLKFFHQYPHEAGINITDGIPLLDDLAAALSDPVPDDSAGSALTLPDLKTGRPAG